MDKVRKPNISVSKDMMYIVIMQYQVAITTDFQVLTHCMSIKLCSRSQTNVQSFA
jgi:hypothetical protein